MSTTRAIVATLRPRQWVKNSFVLAPLVFSKHLFDPSYAIRAAIATAAFCAISGAVYAFNDVRDIEQDRAHPIKKHRPIAAGALTERAALWMAAGFAAAALGVSAALSLQLLAVIGGYFAIQLAYSIKLKHIAFLDVAIIAGGFLLRVVAGAFAIDVPMSPWLLACTGLLAGLLGFGKRAHELIGAGDSAADTRAALAGYSAGVLQAAMYLLALATVAAYALYTRDHRTVAYFGTGNLIWTLPFCIIGIARFLSLALWKPRADSPTDAILRDWTFMANLLLWGGTVLLIIYGARSGPADAGAAMTVRLSHPIPVEGAMPASIDDAHLSAIDPIATRDDGALAWRLTDVLSDMPGGNSQLEIAGAAGVRTTIAGPTEMAGGREVLVVVWPDGTASVTRARPGDPFVDLAERDRPGSAFRRTGAVQGLQVVVPGDPARGNRGDAPTRGAEADAARVAVFVDGEAAGEWSAAGLDRAAERINGRDEWALDAAATALIGEPVHAVAVATMDEPRVEIAPAPGQTLTLKINRRGIMNILGLAGGRRVRGVTSIYLVSDSR